MWSGRFNLAPADAADGVGWPALYLALDLAVAIGEVQRNMSRGDWDSVRLTEIAVTTSNVVDLRSIPADDARRLALFHDWNYESGHILARAVREIGAEGMLIASASRVGDSLILFPDMLRSDSALTVVRTVDPDLTKAPR